MNVENFTQLIRSITNRDFVISSAYFYDEFPDELEMETEYMIYRELPITKKKVRFIWKTPKSADNFLRSFITAYTSKYREPNPNSNYYKDKWHKYSDTDIERAYFTSLGHMMYSKQELMQQIEENFHNKSITENLIRYGFYNTEYGIGIFIVFNTVWVDKSVEKMKEYLDSKGIPYRNEFSDARWVYRFVLNLDKNKHGRILNDFATWYENNKTSSKTDNKENNRNIVKKAISIAKKYI